VPSNRPQAAGFPLSRRRRRQSFLSPSGSILATSKDGIGPVIKTGHPLTEDATMFLSDWLAVLYALAAVIVYQQPHTHRMLITQIQKARDDPFLGALLGCLVAMLLRSLTRVPRQIMLLTDDSITLHSALGEKLIVSSYYWKTREIFHAYLQAHFHEKPGQDLVAAYWYRILIGGEDGTIVNATKWRSTLRKRMVLTMPILADSISSCPRCKTLLVWHRSWKSIKW
jgi:hypothetical protein